MFRFTMKPSSGSHSQYLAKITHLVQCGYMEVVQMSVLWLQSMTCEAGVQSTNAFLEKLTGSQLLKKLPAFCGTWKLITAIKRSRQLSHFTSNFKLVNSAAIFILTYFLLLNQPNTCRSVNKTIRIFILHVLT